MGHFLIQFWKKGIQRYKKVGPDPNKDLISFKLNYRTKEARMVLHSGLYISCCPHPPLSVEPMM